MKQINFIIFIFNSFMACKTLVYSLQALYFNIQAILFEIL
jgi:hypothetical protein